jgi:Rad3-related DNA helicase
MMEVQEWCREDGCYSMRTLGEVFAAAGGNPFMDRQVPQVMIKLKQGFGRLIRTATETGMVVLFDPRVLTKHYGRAFLDALPEAKWFEDGRRNALPSGSELSLSRYNAPRCD